MFNTASDDPSYRFSVPADGTYRLLVRDLYYYGDPRYVYRLVIRPEQPDFRLVAVAPFPTTNRNQTNTWSTLVRKGGTELLEVLAYRLEGFNGEIEVSVEGLPAGVSCPTVTMGPGQDSVPLVFTADENAKEWSGDIQVVGKAKINDKPVTRQAHGGAVVWAGVNNAAAPARMTRNICLSVSGTESDDFLVKAGDGKPFEMSRTGNLEIPITVVRRNNFKGNIALTAQDLISKMKVGNVTVQGAKNDGKVTMNIPPDVPPGTYTFYMLASTQVDYKKNEDLAKEEAERQKEINKLADELTKASKDAAAEAAKAAQAKTAADKAASDAAAKLKQATDALKAAEDKLNKAPEDKALSEAKAAAEKALAEAKKASEDAAAKAKEATGAKAEADKSAAEAAAKAKAGEAEKAAAAKRVTAANNVAKAKKTNVFAPSTAIVVKVTEAPITMKAPGPAKAKQGEKVEVPVDIERLYKYDDPVQLDVTVPGGVKGLKIAKATIAKGQKQGKIVVDVAADATPGEHVLSIKATARFNNQNLVVTAEAPLSVEKVEQPKKK